MARLSKQNIGKIRATKTKVNGGFMEYKCDEYCGECQNETCIGKQVNERIVKEIKTRKNTEQKHLIEEE